MPGELIPILTSLGLFALIFGIVYMNKKENLAMIDKGMDPKQRAVRGPEPFKYLKWGLLLLGSGIGLVVAFLVDDLLLSSHEPHPLYFGLVGIGGGIGLIISYKMEMKELKGSSNNGGAV